MNEKKKEVWSCSPVHRHNYQQYALPSLSTPSLLFASVTNHPWLTCFNEFSFYRRFISFLKFTFAIVLPIFFLLISKTNVLFFFAIANKYRRRPGKSWSVAGCRTEHWGVILKENNRSTGGNSVQDCLKIYSL